MLVVGASSKALIWTQAVFIEPTTQRIIFFCVAFYTFLFIIFQAKLKKIDLISMTNPNLLLLIVLIIGVLVYTLNYESLTRSEDALVWLAGVMLGQAAALCKVLEQRKAGLSLKIIGILSLFLSIASLCNTDYDQVRYLGRIRWSGVWHDPNIFGFLMGVGITLTVGFGLQAMRKAPVQKEGITAWRSILWKHKMAILFFIMITLMGCGLACSYSRGAWFATFSGLVYLLHFAARGLAPERTFMSSFSWLSRNWPSLFAILICAIVLAFWNFRQTEWRPLHRLFSVGNQNDFSWRNRVSAWNGALQITVEHPLCGVGWNRPEPMYAQYYCTSRVIEDAAIQVNDWLFIGDALGIPALLCLATYVWLRLTQTPKRSIESRNPLSTADWIEVTSRAGAIVLLVGFWFNGGLFKLGTSAAFWILLELGGANLVQDTTTEKSKANVTIV